MATPTTLPASFVAGNVLQAAQLNDLRGAFRILQFDAVQKNDAFTTSSTSYVDLTGLSISITPSATSSKIFIGYTVQGQGLNLNNMGGIQIVRGSTAIGNSAAAGTRSVANTVMSEMAGTQIAQQAGFYLDSPATTSATTYKLQIRSFVSNTIYVNRTITDTDSSAFGRGTSSLFVCEISA